ncbi:hypothetical protein ACX9VS_02960 [Weissella paramesenteroides]
MESQILALYRDAKNEAATSFDIPMDICQSKTEIKNIFKKYHIPVDVEKGWGIYTVAIL